MCASGDTVTLLDINNSVPRDLYESDIKTDDELYPERHLHGLPLRQHAFVQVEKGWRKIPAHPEPPLRRRRHAGYYPRHPRRDIAESPITFFRLQSTAGGQLRAYIAQGEVLPAATQSFGGIGIFAIPEMGRFYRHVLIANSILITAPSPLPTSEKSSSPSSSTWASKTSPSTSQKACSIPTKIPLTCKSLLILKDGTNHFVRLFVIYTVIFLNRYFNNSHSHGLSFSFFRCPNDPGVPKGFE